MGEGWANVDTDDIFEEGLHAWAANLTVPMMMISMLSALALVIVTTVQCRKGSDPVELEMHNLRKVIALSTSSGSGHE